MSIMLIIERRAPSKKQQGNISNAKTNPTWTKKRESTKQRSSSIHSRTVRRSPSFWDSLRSIRLNRGVLNEFDRRTCSNTEEKFGLPLVQTQIREISNVPKALKQFARNGGPDLSHLRQVTGVNMTSKRPKFAKSNSAYSSNNRQILIDAGVYPVGYQYDERPLPPANLEDINRALGDERRSLSPSRLTDKQFEDFSNLYDLADSEIKVITDIIHIIKGKNQKHFDSGQLPFNNILTFGEAGKEKKDGRSKQQNKKGKGKSKKSLLYVKLSDPKPDLHDGINPSKIRQRVRADLHEFIIPCTHEHRPAAPNFYLEAKGPSGRQDHAIQQACHDGAVGARAIHSLQNYGAQETVFDGCAYSFSSTIHGGTLTLYATYPCEADAEQKQRGIDVEYHMRRLRSFSLQDTPNVFREAVRCFRNLRDLAGRYRVEFVNHANEVAKTLPSPVSTSFTSSSTQRSHSTHTQTRLIESFASVGSSNAGTSMDELAYADDNDEMAHSFTSQRSLYTRVAAKANSATTTSSRRNNASRPSGITKNTRARRGKSKGRS